MTEEQQNDPIDEEELPQAGNSDAKLYPKVEDAQGGDAEDDEQQATHGDAAAVREDDPGPSDAA